jgi:hypothetical protein
MIELSCQRPQSTLILMIIFEEDGGTARKYPTDYCSIRQSDISEASHSLRGSENYHRLASAPLRVLFDGIASAVKTAHQSSGAAER